MAIGEVHTAGENEATHLKSLRKRFPWILLTLLLLPVLLTALWYYRKDRQQRLDHALIEAIEQNDT